MTRITYKHRTITGEGWTQEIYDLYRNGIEIGTAFKKPNGFALEAGHYRTGFYRTMKELKASFNWTPKIPTGKLAGA